MPTTLISVAHAALRSRRRQYEARELIGRYELLARELQHRTKNLLAVILSIAAGSLKDGGGGNEAFVSRLHALAKAQDLLTEREDQRALLEDVIKIVLAGFGDRISLEGPQIYLTPSMAQGFALVVHELATNSAKHGALTRSWRNSRGALVTAGPGLTSRNRFQLAGAGWSPCTATDASRLWKSFT